MESLGGAATEARAEVDAVKDLIVRMRAMKADYGLANAKDARFKLLPEGNAASVIKAHLPTILNLAGSADVEVVSERPEGCPAGVTRLGTAFIDLAGSIDVAAERERLQKELDKLTKGMRAGEAKLSNAQFLANAPEAVVAGARQQLEQTKAKHAEVSALLDSLPAA
jgi:valyl-tRNA synthetase